MLYDPNNVFAKILRKELPCKKVYEDDYVLSFYTLEPKAPVHVLVIPKVEAVSFHEFCAGNDPEYIGNFFKSVRKTVDMLDLPNGYRIVANTGKDSGQTVFHFHVHIIGGKILGDEMPE
ncbi:MAG: HIT domain-containing protein [Alphaproteobacteria bacterium]|nr:HIT domain-containing protein [Alphaproteobacteria bacterium]OJV14197.1 MAG: hypothetical protein BGO27_01705 [Alphaproteobacteria bacterium 33-17]